MKQAWLRQCTDLFLATTHTLTPPQYARPSALPGWSRAHVIAHIHFNALALRRLVTWAATGTENPMYQSREQRDTEIEHGARIPADDLQRLVETSAKDLVTAYEALTATALASTVRTARGRDVPAREIAWLRTRELAVHSLDLAATVTWSNLPADLVTEIATDALTDHRYHLGALAAYLTGRTDTAPTLRPWLD